MEDKREKGFVLVLVVGIIAVIGLEMFVLAGGSNTMLFQADTAYLRAVESNLAASGLTWAKRNIKDQNKEIFDKTIELDVTNMNIRNANLSIIVGVPSGKEVQVQIRASCSKSRQTLRSGDKYTVGL